MATKLFENDETEEIEEEEEEEEEEVNERFEDWGDWDTNEEDFDTDLTCLFCDAMYNSSETLFQHCSLDHQFDFLRIRQTLGLDFYASFKLINYVRSQVAANRCWSCGLTCQTNRDLQNHLHEAVSFQKDGKFPWEDDEYLKPFMLEDSLLHSFGEDEDVEDDHATSVDREEIIRELSISVDLKELYIDDDNVSNMLSSKPIPTNGSEIEKRSPTSAGFQNTENSSKKVMGNGVDAKRDGELAHQKQKGKNFRVSFANVVAKEIKSINDDYFGAYGSFGIHREMIGDKVRMTAYRGAILNNPSLLKGATVLDVGCGTGILSMFAAQAGASRVIAVEASDKMAAVATQIAKDNDLLCNGSSSKSNTDCTGLINVVNCMVEELDTFTQIPPHSVDVLLSEWMGYCLLYESMLSSVLYARDRWLKPGGAILPDTATIFVAGFGRGGTSLPFWDDVYGLNMSCIGKELVEDAVKIPIVDVVDSRDIVTNTKVLQNFDLATMKPDEMDFTASFELEPKLDLPSSDLKSKTISCYGVVLWFETGFTSRFCKEMPTVLSTSPYSPKTHWSQSIFTFREPIVMALGKADEGSNGIEVIGTNTCPAIKIQSRISIVRAAQHRSIDISMETMCIGSDGRKRSWPVQIFNL